MRIITRSNCSQEIYDHSEAFQLLKSDQLAQDKKLTGYIVFPVEKRQEVRSAV